MPCIPDETLKQKKRILTAIKETIDHEKAKQHNEREYQVKLKSFLASANTKYKLSPSEFKREVVRGDGVDDIGMSLGHLLFKLNNSRSFTLKDYSVKNRKVKELDLVLSNRANDEELNFNFVLGDKFVFLRHVQVGKVRLHGAECAAILFLAFM